MKNRLSPKGFARSKEQSEVDLTDLMQESALFPGTM